MHKIMNIPYELAPSDSRLPCRFHSIWKVHANESYQVAKQNGFSEPGLFVTIEGTGSLTLNGEKRLLHAGTFFIADVDMPCSYCCIDDNWKFYFIDFVGTDMIKELELAIGQVTTSAKVADSVKLCEKIIETLIVKPVGYVYSVNILLQELILLFAREKSITNTTRDPELDTVLYHMHQNIDKPFRVQDYIAESGLTRTTFFSRFRGMTGQSPAQYMLDLKLASAKASLETTNLSSKEIALALNFYDEFHFSKMFKQRYGFSPRIYRKMRTESDNSRH